MYCMNEHRWLGGVCIAQADLFLTLRRVGFWEGICGFPSTAFSIYDFRRRLSVGE